MAEAKINNGFGNTKTLALLLGLTERAVQKLTKAGTLQKATNFDYDLQKSIEAYYYNKFHVGEDELDLRKEQAKHERTKREISELKLAKLKNEVHSAERIRAVLTDMLSNLRAQLLGLPAILAPKLDGKRADEIQEIINSYIEEKLQMITEYTPEMFAEVEDEESS